MSFPAVAVAALLTWSATAVSAQTVEPHSASISRRAGNQRLARQLGFD
jgi:hypothetical protein